MTVARPRRPCKAVASSLRVRDTGRVETAPEPATVRERTALLAAARGFAATFWGLLLIFLALIGAALIAPLEHLHLPAHLPGLLVLTVGALWFREAAALDPAWNRVTLLWLLAVCAQLYFLPFLTRWLPSTPAWYTRINLTLFALATAAVPILYLHLLARWAHVLGDHTLRIEVRLGAWGIPLLALAAAGLAVLRGWLFTQRSTLDPEAIWPLLLRDAPALALVPTALPLILALALAWEAKEHTFTRLVGAPAGPGECTQH